MLQISMTDYYKETIKYLGIGIDSKGTIWADVEFCYGVMYKSRYETGLGLDKGCIEYEME